MTFDSSTPLIIGEISGNHGGSAESLLELVKAAVRSGLRCIKFQLYETHEVLSNKSFVLRDTKWEGENLFDLYKQNETQISWLKESISYLRRNNIIYGFTVSGPSSLEKVLNIGCDFLKIASFDAMDFSLINLCLESHPVLIISDGVMDSSRRKLFLNYLSKKIHSSHDITFLHCSSVYPSDILAYDISAFVEDVSFCPRMRIGISDHTLDNSLIFYAYGSGFSVFEKHIKMATDNKSVDSFFSSDVESLGLLQRQLDSIERRNNIHDSKRTMNDIQRACYWQTSHKKGDMICRDSIFFRRVLFEDGYLPEDVDMLISRKLLSRDVAAGAPVVESDFC